MSSDSKAVFSFKESKRATATVNRIRAVVDQIKIPKAPEDKPMIPLSLGDPTFFGNLPPPPNVIDAICDATRSGKFNGYAPAHGHVSARKAVAKKYSRDDHKLDENDIIIASGCSDCLKIIIHATVGEGDELLIPRPCFALYVTLTENNGATPVFYPLLADSQWELDLKAMDELVTPRTKAILINNPCNPCGSSYSRKHLEEIADFARKHKLLIIADEIYGGIIFTGSTFTSLAEVAPDLPIVVAGGIAKQYCAPGWRLGWLIFYDKTTALDEIHKACLRMTQLIVGCNALIQGALPDIILNTPKEFYTNLNATLESQAQTFCKALDAVAGLSVKVPQGAMYLLVQVQLDLFPDYETDTQFCQALLDEEFVFVLPGGCFFTESLFRVVFCAPTDMLADAANRISNFCDRHRVVTADQ